MMNTYMKVTFRRLSRSPAGNTVSWQLCTSLLRELQNFNMNNFTILYTIGHFQNNQQHCPASPASNYTKCVIKSHCSIRLESSIELSWIYMARLSSAFANGTTWNFESPILTIHRHLTYTHSLSSSTRLSNIPDGNNLMGLLYRDLQWSTEQRKHEIMWHQIYQCDKFNTDTFIYTGRWNSVLCSLFHDSGVYSYRWL